MTTRDARGPLAASLWTVHLLQTLFRDVHEFLRPGMMVTQEYRAERLNFRIGPDNRIVEIRCG